MTEADIKSVDWFLYDIGLRHKRVKQIAYAVGHMFSNQCKQSSALWSLCAIIQIDLQPGKDKY